MKNKKKKILTLILIIFILLFCLGAKSYAFGVDDAIDGVVGILLLPSKFFALIIGGVIGTILGFFTNMDGIGLTLEDILFNRVPLVDINFFDFTTANDVALTIRENVAIWYTSIRNIAAVVLAIIAVYVGIRMAISTIAEDKAKYKTMLYDWLTSLALLFVLQYVMIFTININNAFIETLSTGLSDSSFGSMTDTFFKESLTNASFTTGMGCALIYLMLQAVTFVFLLTYIKRMITLAFLIVISPLVTITYSIDKMGDGRSQALNVWFKEFVYNILIQPFHCISYRVLAQSAINLMVRDGFAEGAGLANAVIAIMMILFIYSAEEIIKHIFHFESQSMGKTVANAAIGGLVLNKVMSGKKKSGGGSSSKGYSSGTNSKSSSNKSAQNANQNSNQGGAPNAGQNSNTNSNTNRSQSTRSSSSGGSTGTSGSSSSNRQNTKSVGGVAKKVAKTVGKGAGNVALGVFKKNPQIAGAMIMGGLGLGLGDAKTGFAGMMAGAGMGSSVQKANQDRILKHDLARAVNRYKSENPNLTQDELTNNALHLADGSLAPQTEVEEELANIMQKMEQTFIDNGVDEKKIPKQFKKLITDIDDGKISEYSTFQRFTGNIKSKFKGNNSNNASNSSNNNSNTNSNNNINFNTRNSINNINNLNNINNSTNNSNRNNNNNGSNSRNNSNRNNNVNNNNSNNSNSNNNNNSNSSGNSNSSNSNNS